MTDDEIADFLPKTSDIWKEAKQEILSLRQQLAECQAREKVRVARLKSIGFVLRNGTVSVTGADKVQDALALPSDSTALDTLLKRAKREALLEAVTVTENLASLGYAWNDIVGDLRRMVKDYE